MRMEKFISELLYEHDCVIIPGFGGLVANYRSARLNKLTHIVHPPSKHVGFNRNLIQNDGLLANHMAVVMGISYREASDLVQREVVAIKNQLQGNGRLVWDKIGIFFNDRSGSLQFIPEDQENFLIASYGLTSIQLRPIAAEAPIEPETEQNLEAAPAPIVMNTSRIQPWKIAAAIITPIAIASAFLLGGRIGGDHINFTSLNPFQTERIDAPYRMVVSNGVEVNVDSSMNALKQLVEQSSGDVILYDFVEAKESSTGVRVEVDKQRIAPVDSTSTAAIPAPKEMRQGTYHIIGGAFAIESNATNLVNELESKGYSAFMAGKKGPLHLVAYGSFSTESEARRALAEIKSKEGKGAWIKKIK
ncbi:MAG: SPOR domain-containing protein [Flavobacteriales bacterium]